jgi:hypothetical protein
MNINTSTYKLYMNIHTSTHMHTYIQILGHQTSVKERGVESDIVFRI